VGCTSTALAAVAVPRSSPPPRRARAPRAPIKPRRSNPGSTWSSATRQAVTVSCSTPSSTKRRRLSAQVSHVQTPRLLLLRELRWNRPVHPARTRLAARSTLASRSTVRIRTSAARRAPGAAHMQLRAPQVAVPSCAACRYLFLRSDTRRLRGHQSSLAGVTQGAHGPQRHAKPSPCRAVHRRAQSAAGYQHK